ncbi:MAG: CHAP domain-containing protein [Propionicimonas sp.]
MNTSVAQRLTLVGTLGFLLLALLGTPTAHAAPVGWACYGAYNQACVSQFGYVGQSTWGYPVDPSGNNCTNYAAFRLAQNGAANPGNLGNANQWDDNARAKGFSVNQTAAVGAIAQWESQHVAYIDWASADGNEIAISETSYGGTYNGVVVKSSSARRVVTRGSASWPSNIIHIKDLALWPPAEGSFVRVTDNGEVYRIVGGAPVYQASLAGLGYVSHQDVSRAQLNSLPAQPRDGVFINGVPSGRVLRLAGGAPEYVSTWNSFGGSKPTIAVYDAAIDHAGEGGVWAHLNRYPRDGTFISNTADGRVYRVAGGAPLYVSSWSNIGGEQPATALDPWEFSQYQHLRPVPTDRFVRGLPSGRVFRVVADGRPYYVESWTPYGGTQPFLDVDDWAIDNCDHLNCSPLGAFDAANSGAGTVNVTGWAIDPNVRTTAVSIHVYVGGPAGDAAAEGFNIGLASSLRTDVGQVYPGTGQNHGFSTALTTSKRGTQSVYVYAINAAGTPGNNFLLGKRTLTVNAGTLSSAPTPVLGNTAPVVGQVVSVSPGTWGPAPVSLALQWIRVSASGTESVIAGATAASYKVQLADAGYGLRVRVTGSKGGYTTVTKASSATAVVPTLPLTQTPTPTVTGTARVDRALTATPGTWGPAPVTVAFQWYRVNSVGTTSAIGGATAATYQVQPADVGYKMRVKATGSTTGYTTTSKWSAATGTVVKATLTAAPTPAVSGTAQVDQRLTAIPGTWGPAPITLAYQWYRVNTAGTSSAITGSTAATYKVQSADVGYTVRVRVIGSKPGYVSVTKWSAATAKVVKATLTATPKPIVTGTTIVGQALTATPGSWAPAPVTLAHQWYRISSTGSRSAITGATAAKYTLTSSDRGKTIQVRVAGAKAGYTSVYQYSTPTTPTR